MESAARPLTETRARRGVRRRLLRHYLPLALGSAVLLLLLMTLPRFDSGKQVDIFSGTLPKDFPAGQTGPMQHGGRQASPQRGGAHAIPPEILKQIPKEHRKEIQGLSPTSEEVEDRSFVRRLTTATGYLALALLALSLLIGPANLLLRRRNPVSSYLRRDVGAWTALFSGVHVVISLKVHGSGQIRDFLDFFAPGGDPLTNSFGWANWTGLGGLVVVAGLLALSSDAVLRKLKAKNWKRLQRLNYALFALVIVHAFFYGALLRTTSPYTILLGLIVITVVAGQLLGVWLYRRRYARKTAEPAAAAASRR
jgi:sulfoxide reductase heme-binding subunit YedZ